VGDTGKIFSAAVAVTVATTAIVSGTPWGSASARGPDGIALMAQNVSTGASSVAATVYGPAGAPACTGVAIGVAQEAQSVVERYPAGTAFCFSAGVHRITRTIKPGAGTTLGSSTRAVLTGSKRLSTWAANSGDWKATGVLPAAYGMTGQCEDNVANICYLREQIFQDGVHLRRVATRALVVPGTFYGDYAANAVYVGTNPATRAMEISRTNTAISSGSANVTVRGLTVEHFASASQAGAVVAGPGWRVQSNDIRDNHAVGVMLVNADNAVLSQNFIRRNGQLGVGQYSSVNGRITANHINNNNTDGYWIADWESGGIKTTWSSGGAVTNNQIWANLGVGLWSDAYDENRTFSGNHIENNAACGIRFEIGRNGVIANNTVIRNGYGTRRNSGTSLWDGAGINVNTSSNVQVRNNYVAGNVNGVSIQSRTRGSGPWGLNVLRDVLVSNNTISMRAGTQATGMVQNGGSPLPAGELVFKYNAYLVESLAAKHFQRFGTWHTSTTWPKTGNDVGSTYKVM
jgi:parallel beta-helix repeat protein